MSRRRALLAASRGVGNQSGLNFPITLVEGDNGQLGIDVFNYYLPKAQEADFSFAIEDELYFKGVSYSNFDGPIDAVTFLGTNALRFSLQNNLNVANLHISSDGVVTLNIYG